MFTRIARIAGFHGTLYAVFVHLLAVFFSTFSLCFSVPARRRAPSLVSAVLPGGLGVALSVSPFALNYQQRRTMIILDKEQIDDMRVRSASELEPRVMAESVVLETTITKPAEPVPAEKPEQITADTLDEQQIRDLTAIFAREVPKAKWTIEGVKKRIEPPVVFVAFAEPTSRKLVGFGRVIPYNPDFCTRVLACWFACITPFNFV